MPKKLYLIIFAIILLSGIFFLKVYFNNKIEASTTKAESSGYLLDTKTKWDEGSQSNISSTGTISILTKGSTAIPLTAGMLSANADQAGVNGVLEANGGSWAAVDTAGLLGLGDNLYFQVDLGEEKNIKRFYVSYLREYISGSAGRHIIISTSTNGTDFTEATRADFTPTNWPPPMDVTLASPVTARYVRYTCYSPSGNGGPPPGLPQEYLPNIDLINIYSDSSARHTTGSTQIDGGENFWNWDSFTDTKTVPANTSVTYRYRTSPDAGTWTSWTSNFASVTSRSGDTKYRYLQVEATLSNTDSASTPTIDQYDIDYHTEIKPSAPTAQTAAVQ